MNANSGMGMNDIKQLMVTKMMLGGGNQGNTNDDIYKMIGIMIFMGIINYIFTILPLAGKFILDHFHKKMENITHDILPPVSKPIKSRIKFSRNYKKNEGYELIDALIEYLSNIDSVITLYRQRFYVMGSKKNESFKVNEDITCVLKLANSTDDGYDQIDFELYSETLLLSELRKWVDNTYKTIEYNKQNKFGDDRFFFNETSQSNPGNPSKNLIFSMTKFHTNKSLNTLYGPSIKILKNRVELFKNNANWYKKNGIPHTLGILLHGPPGSGKTSVIKGIAKDLNRHIFNLKLTKNTTQTQMWNLFYNDSIYCLSDNTSAPNRNYIPTDQRVYVLEDVDCLTSVLLDRKIKQEEDRKQQMAEEMKNKNTKSGMNINYEAKKKMEEMQNEGDNAKLNLSFILGLIDGLLETPGRILIISSNYPERLDKAILRPGRIDINMRLGECDTNTIREMFINFYEGRTKEDFSTYDLESMNEVFTPAYIQKILSDYFDNPNQAYKQLQIEVEIFKKQDKEEKRKKLEEELKQDEDNKRLYDNMTSTEEIINSEIEEIFKEENKTLCDVKTIKKMFVDFCKASPALEKILTEKPFAIMNNKFTKEFLKEVLKNAIDGEMAYDMLITKANNLARLSCEKKTNLMDILEDPIEELEAHDILEVKDLQIKDNMIENFFSNKKINFDNNADSVLDNLKKIQNAPDHIKSFIKDFEKNNNISVF